MIRKKKAVNDKKPVKTASSKKISKAVGSKKKVSKAINGKKVQKDKKVNLPAVHVEQYKDIWIVKNEGDSAVLFSASEKEKAVKFAKGMAKEHEIKLVVYDDEKKKQEKVQTEKEPVIYVEKEGEDWVVRNEGDSATLFRASDKEASLKFAKEMAKNHEVKLVVNESSGSDYDRRKEDIERERERDREREKERESERERDREREKRNEREKERERERREERDRQEDREREWKREVKERELQWEKEVREREERDREERRERERK